MRELFSPTVAHLSSILIGSILTVLLLVPGAVNGQAAKKSAPVCGRPELLSGHPVSELPDRIQSTLRQAVKAGVTAIIRDPGMGMSDANPDTIALNAIEVARSAGPNVLYVVAWDDNTFGVNGFNWIIEANPKEAFSLLSSQASSLAGGFGVEVLGSSTDRYPELMIASKGYAQGGGAEGEAGCFHKIGSFYESTSCPKTCQDELNDR
jgi:hypothetical protein